MIHHPVTGGGGNVDAGLALQDTGHGLRGLLGFVGLLLGFAFWFQ